MASPRTAHAQFSIHHVGLLRVGASSRDWRILAVKSKSTLHAVIVRSLPVRGLASSEGSNFNVSVYRFFSSMELCVRVPLDWMGRPSSLLERIPVSGRRQPLSWQGTKILICAPEMRTRP